MILHTYEQNEVPCCFGTSTNEVFDRFEEVLLAVKEMFDSSHCDF